MALAHLSNMISVVGVPNSFKICDVVIFKS